MVKGNSDFAAVGVPVSFVASSLTPQLKPITQKCGRHLARGDAVKLCPVDWHALDGYRNLWLVGDKDIVAR